MVKQKGKCYAFLITKPAIGDNLNENIFYLL